MNNLAQNISTMQAPGKGEHKVNKDEMGRYVLSVINNYATYQNGKLFLFAGDLPREEQVIFLSRLSHPRDYEWFMRTDARLTAALDEYLPEMQSLICAALPDAWIAVQDEIDRWKHSTETFWKEKMYLPDGMTSDHYPDIYRY